MRISGLLIMVTMLALQSAAVAQAQTRTDRDAGRRLYATCAACHGADGRPVAGSALPPLASQSREALVASMKAFQEGSRPATIMHQIARGYTSEQIELIAGYLAAPDK